MTEAELIGQIRQLAGKPFRKLIVKGIGDDCAILRPRPKNDLVFTTDFVLEDRHFTLATHTPGEIGYKALARGLSDLAAMGAEPLFCLVSLALPASLAEEFVPAFYKGLLELAGEVKISLAGGDLAQFPQVVADVMCCGLVPRAQSLLRTAAQRGDNIYVSGSLGHSALGLRTKDGPAWQRHLRPVPRIELGMNLKRLKVRCAMDLSDGLSQDLSRICMESNVSANLLSPLPVAAGATLDDALHGGEDYELLFTAPHWKKIPAMVAGERITKIGVITERAENLVTLDGEPLPQAGFDHFA